MTPSRTTGPLGTTARRQRQRLLRSLLLGLVATGGLLFSLGAAYLMGTSQRAAEIERLQADLEGARAIAREATARAAAAEERAARLLERGQNTRESARPSRSPEIDSLVPLLVARLAEGMSRERLARAIAAVTVQQVCDPGIEERTLTVAVTPTREAGGRSFAGGRFNVLARGVPAKSPTGRTEAWFDPGQPVQLTIRQAGQEPKIVTGKLPFVESIVLDRREYRFTARAGDRRGTIDLLLETCDYP
jgi:hypothetical protein